MDGAAPGRRQRVSTQDKKPYAIEPTVQWARGGLIRLLPEVDGLRQSPLLIESPPSGQRSLTPFSAANSARPLPW